MKDLPYTLLDHTGDMAVCITGSDPIDLFENAGRALIHIALGDVPKDQGPSFSIDLSGEDLEDLLVQWLGEILYLLEGEKQIATVFSVEHLTASHLKATLGIIPFDPGRHEILTEIKAVTYHQIQVTDRGDHWEAVVIMDV
ncbi:MAG: archease [Deltaproteobacteria bacterium]|nr:archease [Deltaproteobacteria bacterium]